jgi:hypothetical protein
MLTSTRLKPFSSSTRGFISTGRTRTSSSGPTLLDGTSYNALVFASAETRPDNVKAVVLLKQILLVFGETTIEPWQDIGAANMPLERVPGVVIERGLAAPRAIAKEDNTAFFLGEDRRFYGWMASPRSGSARPHSTRSGRTTVRFRTRSASPIHGPDTSSLFCSSSRRTRRLFGISRPAFGTSASRGTSTAGLWALAGQLRD